MYVLLLVFRQHFNLSKMEAHEQLAGVFLRVCVLVLDICFFVVDWCGYGRGCGLHMSAGRFSVTIRTATLESSRLWTR